MKKGSFRKLFMVALTALFLLSAFPAATAAAKGRPTITEVSASGPLCVETEPTIQGQRGPVLFASGEVLESLSSWTSSDEWDGFNGANVKVTLTRQMFLVNLEEDSFFGTFSGQIEVTKDVDGDGDDDETLTGEVMGSVAGKGLPETGLIADTATFDISWSLSGDGVKARGSGSGTLHGKCTADGEDATVNGVAIVS